MSDFFWKTIIGAAVTLTLAWMAQRANSKLNTIHVLVNNSFGVQLKLAMVALKRVASLTKNKADIHAAKLAEDSYNEHQRKQSQVDSN